MSKKTTFKARILVAITSNTGREMYLAPFANSLVKVCRNVPREYYIDIHTFAGLRIDVVRTECVIFAQKYGYDAIVFLDDDMIFPEDAITKLIGHWEDGMQVVGGLYGSKTFPYHLFIRPDIRKDWLRQCDHTQMYQSQAMATGCLLIDMQVFPKLTKPWFLLHFDKNFGRLITTEDCFFSIRCNDAGIPMFVDASIECQHLKLIAFPDFWKIEGQHYDGEYDPKTIKPDATYGRSGGPLVMHSLEGSYAVDGVMECRHDHQIPIQVNEGEAPLYRCMDCDLISRGPDISCNEIDPRNASPQDIEKGLIELEKEKVI